MAGEAPIEHRRRDGELLGWMRPEGDGFVPVDLLGRDVGPASDWFDAAQALDGIGLGYLADPYELRRHEGSWVRVKLVEVTPAAVTVPEGWSSGIDAPGAEHTLALPLEGVLRPYVRA